MADDPGGESGRVAEAEDLADDRQVLGTPGPLVSWRSPVMVGLIGAAGVLVTYELG